MITNSNYLEIDGAKFDSAVLNSRSPVLVVFVTQRSRPCCILGSVLDEIASLYSKKLKVVWVNADENPDLVLRYGIRAVPTLLYFVAGNVRTKLAWTAANAVTSSQLGTDQPWKQEKGAIAMGAET